MVKDPYSIGKRIGRMQENESLDNHLAGKVAIVTGASRRIGRATALGLARQGADLVITARAARDEIETVAEEIRAMGRKATPLLCDLRKAAAASQVVEVAANEHGRLDILVNNAAVRRSIPFLEMAFDEWNDTLSVILDGSFRMCQAALPLMLETGNGTIISVGGAPAHRGARNRAQVCAAKAGIVGLTKAIAFEFADRGITANCVVPGMIGGEADRSSSDSNRAASAVPLGRLGDVEEVAGTIVSLCLPHARFTTGQTLHVSGGLYMP